MSVHSRALDIVQASAAATYVSKPSAILVLLTRKFSR